MAIAILRRYAGPACLQAAFAITVAALAGFGVAAAQDVVPSSQEMVEKLRQPARTRSLRNLVVERPSLSLQIQFEFDSAQVRPESRLALENLARALQASELSGSRFAVEGHTDARGRPEYNLQLSRRRAEAVRQVLAQHGADPARLLAEGKGSREPADPADPYSAANRRVRIVNMD